MSDLKPSPDTLYVKFWGVRGSIPAAGARFEEFGGNTPCLEIRCGERLYVVDAGSGMVPLGPLVAAEGTEPIDVVLSHLHLDHVSGLPFFRPALQPGRAIRLHCGNLDGRSAEEPLGRLFSAPLFPIELSRLPARFEHHGFRAGERLTFADGTSADTLPLNHPGGATGYRFSFRGRRICYISDIEHTDPWPPPELKAFVKGADLVVYDGMFSETEYLRCQGWGHSTWQKGVALALAARVKRLAIFHLHPQHDDAYLHELEREVRAAMPGAFLAREGQALSFPAKA